MSTENTTTSLTVATSTQEVTINSRYSAEDIEARSLGNIEQLPDLADYEVETLPVNIGYWTPEKAGEQFKGYVVAETVEMMPEYNCPPERKHILFPVNCVTLVRWEDAGMRQYRVAQKVLVSHIKSGIKTGRIIPFTDITPIVITYLGKKKNKTNQSESMDFTVETARRRATV